MAGDSEILQEITPDNEDAVEMETDTEIQPLSPVSNNMDRSTSLQAQRSPGSSCKDKYQCSIDSLLVASPQPLASAKTLEIDVAGLSQTLDKILSFV